MNTRRADAVDEARSKPQVKTARERVWAAWVALTLLVVLLSGGALVDTLPRAPRQGELAVDALKQGAAPRVLAFGSSHVHMNVNPSESTLSWMNLSGGMINYELLEGVVAGHLLQSSRTEVVVLEIGALLATHDSIEEYHGDNYSVLDLDPSLEAVRLPLLDGLSLRTDRFLEYDMPFSRLLTRDKLDLDSIRASLKGLKVDPDVVVGPGYEGGVSSHLERQSGQERVEMHVRGGGRWETMVPRNLDAFRRILAVVEGRDLPLVLLRTPHHPEYVAHRPKHFSRAYEQLLARAREAFKEERLLLLDYDRAFSSDSELWRDADHLSYAAGTRFTRQVSQVVENWVETGERPASLPEIIQ